MEPDLCGQKGISGKVWAEGACDMDCRCYDNWLFWNAVRAKQLCQLLVNVILDQRTCHFVWGSINRKWGQKLHLHGKSRLSFRISNVVVLLPLLSCRHAASSPVFHFPPEQGLMAAAYVQDLNMHMGLHQKLVKALERYEASAAASSYLQSAAISFQNQVDGFTPEAVLVGKWVFPLSSSV